MLSAITDDPDGHRPNFYRWRWGSTVAQHIDTWHNNESTWIVSKHFVEGHEMKYLFRQTISFCIHVLAASCRLELINRYTYMHATGHCRWSARRQVCLPIFYRMALSILGMYRIRNFTSCRNRIRILKIIPEPDLIKSPDIRHNRNRILVYTTRNLPEFHFQNLPDSEPDFEI